jgi:ketosteroid isomerase-like protein
VIRKLMTLCVAGAALCGLAVAEPSRAEQIARAYMDAYSAGDWDKMATYMDEDVVFVDQTNPDPDFQPEYHGPDEALSMLRAFGDQYGLIELGFDFPVIFESNNRVVFSGFVNSYTAPPGADFAYKWHARQVSVVTIEGEKVVRHEDFADYGSQMVTQLPRPAE